MRPRRLSHNLGLASESTVKRLRNKIGVVRDCLRHGRVPLLRFLRVKATDNSAVGKLSLRRIGPVRGGKLREHLYLCQSCLVKTSVETAIGTTLCGNESVRDLRFLF